MKNKIKVAVLGSTGYVGMELVKILSNHSHVDINFLGSETIHGSYLSNINSTKEYIISNYNEDYIMYIIVAYKKVRNIRI